MESLIASRDSTTKTAKPDSQLVRRSSTHTSFRSSDSLEDRNRSQPSRDELNTKQLKKEIRRSTRYHNKECSDDQYCDSDGDAMEDEEENELEGGNHDEMDDSIEVSRPHSNDLEERNNNINRRRGIHRRPNHPELLSEKHSSGKFSADIEDKVSHEDLTNNSISSRSPLSSPSHTIQATAAVSATAGTSASVAVNSFLKFSIQNILQVIKPRQIYL